MNVAITGGSGVLGKKLLKHLGASCKKIFVFKHSKNEIGEIDLIDAQTGSSFFKVDFPVEVFFHLGAANNNSNLDEKGFFKSNVDLPCKLYKRCKELKVKKFIFFSSIKAQTYEEKKCSYYGITKAKAESKLTSISSKKCKLSILRLSPVIFSQSGGNLGLIIKILKLNMPLICFKSGIYNSFDVLKLSDLMNECLKIIKDSNYCPKILNLKSSSPNSTYEIFKYLKQTMSSKSYILLVPDYLFPMRKGTFKNIFDSLFGNNNFK